MNERLKTLSRGQLFWPAVGLVTLLLFNLFFSTGFFHVEVRDGRLYGTLLDILNNSSKVMILAIGMTLVIATEGIDLSVGSVMAIAGAVAAVLVTTTELPFLVVLGIALAVGLAAGLGNGALVAWAGVQPIVATLILMVSGRGLAMRIADEQIITFEHPGFVFIGNGHFLGLPFPFVLALAVFAIAALLTRKTALGLFIEASGSNETAARYAGIAVRQVKLAVYGICGLCAGLAGLIATSNIKAADSSLVGQMMELDAIFAVVVGGTALTGGRFTLVGSMLGALLIQTLTTTMYNQGVSSAVAPVPKAIVIVLVCLLQSEKFRAVLRLPFRRQAGSAP
ncbi:MAG: ribose/xylose/arabinose/galactoside ABC-type transport system permease subunit [Rhodothermales bacterium]|jgi:ribose/xylose/arabinose/galactoside ABC-type transport system permease subunit